MDEIEGLWAEYLIRPFPAEYRGFEVEGVEVLLLDTFIAGCIQTFIDQGRSLDPTRTARLGLLYADAIRVSANLSGDAGLYFSRLERLTELVLNDLADRPLP